MDVAGIGREGGGAGGSGGGGRGGGGGGGAGVENYIEPFHHSDSAGLLARAFHDDPAFSWFFKDRATRMTKLRWLMYNLIDIYSPQNTSKVLRLPPVDEISVSSSGIPKEKRKVKAVLFTNPPLTKETIATFLRPSLFMLPFKVGIRTTVNMLRALVRQGDLKDTILQDFKEKGYWYIGFVAADTDCQGQGLGTRMLLEVLRSADADGVPTYLETAQERNVGWYQRHGFQVVTKERLSVEGPFIWYMRREAGGAEGNVKEMVKRIEEMDGKRKGKGGRGGGSGLRMSIVVAGILLIVAWCFANLLRY